MKKNILLSAIFILLTASVCSAQCPITSTMPCTCGCVKNCPTQNPPQSAIGYKRYVMRVQRNRAAIYNALDLTDEQIKSREELVKEFNPLYDEKFDQLIKETSRLNALKLANSKETEIIKQKCTIQKIKNEIENLVNKEDKTFKKCLTREQRAKYSMIRKLERDDYKKACHNKKDYHKSNPRLRQFGNPRNENCSCDCQKESK